MYVYIYNRRKFRSQTSDNMDRWKAEVEQKNREEKRREEKRREEKRRDERRGDETRREKTRREETRRDEKRREEKRRGEERREEKRRGEERRGEKRREEKRRREKVGKLRNTVFFQWFVAPEGRKVGSLKRRVRSQLARWEMKNCTPLWREAHFEVKMYKAHQVRATLGSWDVEEVHAVAARSTFRSQNAQSTPCSDHFWKLRCRKSARHCGAKHIFKWKS